MKELKHLMYFERLLDDAHNELVRQAEAEGDLAIGYTCFHAPEVLLNLGSCFSVRLRAPHTTSMELATYYMANNSCEFSRAILERALEGNYGFLHAMAQIEAFGAVSFGKGNDAAALEVSQRNAVLLRCLPNAAGLRRLLGRCRGTARTVAVANVGIALLTQQPCHSAEYRRMRGDCALRECLAQQVRLEEDFLIRLDEGRDAAHEIYARLHSRKNLLLVIAVTGDKRHPRHAITLPSRNMLLFYTFFEKDGTSFIVVLCRCAFAGQFALIILLKNRHHSTKCFVRKYV